MKREKEQVNICYDALMFASTQAQARQAAHELVRLILGDEALNQPLEESLRKVCREMRPAKDEREQVRFEAEFLELVAAPTSAAGTMAA